MFILKECILQNYFQSIMYYKVTFKLVHIVNSLLNFHLYVVRNTFISLRLSMTSYITYHILSISYLSMTFHILDRCKYGTKFIHKEHSCLKVKVKTLPGSLMSPLTCTNTTIHECKY